MKLRTFTGYLALVAGFVFAGGIGNMAAAAPTDKTSPTLDVMTFNIRTGKAKDGPDRWEVRKARTIQLIEKYKPELIGLQEALSGQLEDMEQAMPRYNFVGTARVDGRLEGELSPIMYDNTRLQLLRTDTFWLSDTPDKPGTATWGNRFSRICTWAHFKDRKSENYFYLFNTHLDHISQPSRVKGADLILQRIAERDPKDPVIVTGDFNVGEDNPVADAMRKAGFRDSFRVLYPDKKIEGTTNAFTENRQSAKIDYIFVDDAWKVEKAAILDDKFDGRWPSDHLPVTATVRLK